MKRKIVIFFTTLVAIASFIALIMILSYKQSGTPRLTLQLNVPQSVRGTSGAQLQADSANIGNAAKNVLISMGVPGVDIRTIATISNVIDVEDVDNVPLELIELLLPEEMRTTRSSSADYASQLPPFQLLENTGPNAGAIFLLSFTSYTDNATTVERYNEIYKTEVVSQIQDHEFCDAMVDQGATIWTNTSVYTEQVFVGVAPEEMVTPTPTPSGTATTTPTTTPSHSVTASTTPSPSGSPSFTATSTETPTHTSSSSMTGTPTSSLSVGASHSETPSSSETATHSVSVSQTATLTATASNSASSSSTASSSTSVTSSTSQTGTTTATGSNSASHSASASSSVSMTSSMSQTGTVTSTPSTSASPSSSASSSVSTTSSTSQTGTTTATGSNSASHSASASSSVSMTSSMSQTGTVTSTPSTSASPSSSASSSVSMTSSMSQTGTTTATGSNSVSHSASASSSVSATSSTSQTGTTTATGTNSASHSASASSSVSMTSSMSQTGTVTSTPSTSASPSSSASSSVSTTSSASQTGTTTATGTNSASHSASASSSVSATSSMSQTGTVTSTQSSSASHSSSASSSVSMTSSISQTGTVTSTKSSSASHTSSASLTTSASMTASSTPTSSASPSHSPSGSMTTSPSTSPAAVTPSATPCRGSHSPSPTPGLAPSTSLSACSPLSSDTLINQYTTNTQKEGELCALDDTNGFAAVWISSGQDSSGYGVYLRIFDYSGTAVTDEIQVHTETSGNQLNPRCKYVGNGEFMVVWHSQPSSKKEIRGRKFESASGTALTCELTIFADETLDVQYPAVTSTSSGGFVVAWEIATSTSYAIMAQEYDANTDAVGSAFQVNSLAGDRYNYVNLDTLSNGNIVMQWHATDTSNSNRDYYFRLFDGTTMAALNTDQMVNTYSTTGSDRNGLTALPSGGFVVTYHLKNSGTNYDPYVRVYDNAGTAVTGQSIASSALDQSQYPKAVVPVGTAGKFVVVMSDYYRDGSSYSIAAQLMNADATLDGSVFVVNDFTASSQLFPSAIQLPLSKIAITWFSLNQAPDSNQYGVFMKMYCM